MQKECPICFEDFEHGPILYPCKHEPACHDCAAKLKVCPQCNHTLCIVLRFKVLDAQVYCLQIDPWSTIRESKRLLEPLIGDTARGGDAICIWWKSIE